VYETISGKMPFHKHPDIIVFMKVVEGERPPRGDRFTDSLWKMLERCWAPQPNDRPSIEDVLQCLETVSNLSELPSPRSDEGMDEDGDDRDTATRSSGGGSFDSFATGSDHLQSLPIDSPRRHVTDYDLTGKHDMLSAEDAHHLPSPNINFPPAGQSSGQRERPSIGHTQLSSRLTLPLRVASPEPVSSGHSNLRSVHQSPTAAPVPSKRYVDESYDEGVAEVLMDLAKYRSYKPTASGEISAERVTNDDY